MQDRQTLGSHATRRGALVPGEDADHTSGKCSSYPAQEHERTTMKPPARPLRRQRILTAIALFALLAAAAFLGNLQLGIFFAGLCALFIGLEVWVR